MRVCGRCGATRHLVHAIHVVPIAMERREVPLRPAVLGGLAGPCKAVMHVVCGVRFVRFERNEHRALNLMSAVSASCTSPHATLIVRAVE
jgi:hypothetical protein